MAAQLKTICYVAGHSGGHILPCVTLAQQATQNSTVIFIASSKLLDQEIIKKSDTIDQFYKLPISQKRSWWQLPHYAIMLAYSFFKSLGILLWHRPTKIVTTGSIIAIPFCIAGWLARIPIELWELNAIPGKTIKLLAPFATIIKTCFAQSQNYLPESKCAMAAYPIRSEFLNQTKPYWQTNFDKKRFTLFIQGGSQGSQTINTLIMQTFNQYPDLGTHIQIIHQTGTQAQVIKKYYQSQGIPALVFEYDHEIGRYYQTADLIICRSGAGSLFEAIHSKKAIITIPLVSLAGNHQMANAQAAQSAYPDRITALEGTESDIAPLSQTINTLILKKTDQLTRTPNTIII